MKILIVGGGGIPGLFRRGAGGPDSAFRNRGIVPDTGFGFGTTQLRQEIVHAAIINQMAPPDPCLGSLSPLRERAYATSPEEIRQPQERRLLAPNTFTRGQPLIPSLVLTSSCLHGSRSS